MVVKVQQNIMIWNKWMRKNRNRNNFRIKSLQHCYGCFVCLFICFVALHPKSTAMVMAEWSNHLTTLFPGQA